MRAILVPRAANSLRFRFFRRRQRNGAFSVHVGISPFELARHGLHLGLCGGNGNARFQARNDVEKKSAAHFKPLVARRPDPAMHRQRRPNLRRHPDIVLLRCAYDVVSILQGGRGATPPVKRDTALAIAIAMAPGATRPAMCELAPVAFETLAALDHWTERSAAGLAPECDEIICELAEHGLLEVR